MKYLLVLLITLSGCTTVGHRTALVMENKDLWKETNELNRDYYSFEASNQIFVLFPINIYESVNATGLIVPIIPLGENFDKNNENLEITLGLGGQVVEPSSLLEKEALEIIVNGNKIILSEKDFISLKNNSSKPSTYFNNKNYPNYSEFKLGIPIPYSQVQSIEISLGGEKFGFKVPTFKYQKKSGLWSEFILSPGP